MRLSPFIVSLSVAGLGLAACGKKDNPAAPATSTAASAESDEEETDSDAVSTGSLALTVSAISAESGAALALTSGNGFKSTAITSGAPDSMTIYIHKIELLLNGEGGGESSSGPVSLKPSHVDAAEGHLTAAQIAAITALIGHEYETQEALGNALMEAGLSESDMQAWTSDSDFNEDDLAVPAEDGDEAATDAVVFEKDEGVAVAITGSTVDLSAVLAAGATAGDNGAVKFDVAPGTYKAVKVTYRRSALIKGCVTGLFGTPSSTISGSHTYCTQAAKSTFAMSDSYTNAAFEDKDAEDMLFDIGARSLADSNSQWFGDDPTETFSITYSLADDAVIAKGESLAMTYVIDLNRMLRYYNRAIEQGFVPAAPADSVYFFDNTFKDATFLFAGSPGMIRGYEFLAKACSISDFSSSTKACPSSNESYVEVWMTVLADADGVPFSINWLPTDDNTLTVIKGSTYGLDEFVEATEGSTDRMDLHFSLGSDGEGVIMNFPKDLSADDIDSSISGVYYQGLQDMYGEISVVRKL